MGLGEGAVSAVIVVRDGERYLAEAIESVLGQTRPPDQVVVVDNASTDETAEIARRFADVTLVREERPGVGHARNAGLAASSGAFVGFLDHDDLWEPEKTELQLAALEAEPSLDFVLGHVRQFASPELGPEFAARVVIPEEPMPGRFLGAMLVRRDALERVGPWRIGTLSAGDGLEWFIRARDLGLQEAMLSEVVARRRIHGANASFGNHAQRSEWPLLLKESLDRRRAGT